MVGVAKGVVVVALLVQLVASFTKNTHGTYWSCESPDSSLIR